MPQFIPQTDPRAGYLAHRIDIDAAISATLEGGWYILGEECSRFEREFAEFCAGSAGAESVGVANGTDALEIALRAAGVRAGEGVVTVSHTAVATVAAIERAGCVPVLVDIDPATFTLDPERIVPAVRHAAMAGCRVGAVVPVHLYGRPAAMPAIMDVAGGLGLIVVEDCAQAHGAAADGRSVGMWGAAASFSFYPTKNLGALGDGGAVLARDPAVAERARLLRQYGWRERYVSDIPAFNSRLDELQAAVLRVKLRRLSAGNDRRAAIAARYGELLAAAGVDALALPGVAGGMRHAHHQYVVRIGELSGGESSGGESSGGESSGGVSGAGETSRRDMFREAMRERGVGTLIHYPVPVHAQPAYAGRIMTPGGMEHTERAAREVVSLPMYPELTDAAVETVAAAVASALSRP